MVEGIIPHEESLAAEGWQGAARGSVVPVAGAYCQVCSSDMKDNDKPNMSLAEGETEDQRGRILSRGRGSLQKTGWLKIAISIWRCCPTDTDHSYP